MAIIGFNFNKIEAEKKEAMQSKVNVSNNISISKVEEKKFSIETEKQKILCFTFEFLSKYDPDIGSIKLVGDVLLLEEAKKSKEIFDEWNKNKKLPKEIMASILNTALNKCNIQALILSEQINLPPPLPLPKVQMDPKKQ
jgi:hypothetical protein